MNDPALEMVSVAYAEGDTGVFVRFRDERTAFVPFSRYVRRDLHEHIQPRRSRICNASNVLCIPVDDGTDYSIDHLTIRASADLDILHRLKAMELAYAKGCGKTVRSIRRDKGWTQSQLSHRSGLDQAVISKLERGVHSPKLGTLDRIARAFGVDAFYLLKGDSTPTGSNT